MSSRNIFLKKILILGLPIVLNLVFSLSDILNNSTKIHYDAGIWFYMGSLILAGKIPYLDFYEHYPPNISYTYALLMLLTGNSFILFRLCFVIITLLTIFCVYLLAKRMYSETVAIIAVYLLCLNSQIIFWTKMLLSEPISNFFFFSGFLFLIKADTEEKWSRITILGIISGFLFSVAFLYRPTVACLFP
ncbi:MAG: glycosyltransferase family 39 protein, partial [Candidatus Hermodarchaeota archaeon]